VAVQTADQAVQLVNRNRVDEEGEAIDSGKTVIVVDQVVVADVGGGDVVAYVEEQSAVGDVAVATVVVVVGDRVSVDIADWVYVDVAGVV
jgi:hypothetical protein